jgi:hypothetical protein
MNFVSEHNRIGRERLLAEVQGIKRPWDYFVDESLTAARCLKFEEGLLSKDWQQKTMGGRLFYGDAELRWGLAGGEFDLWLLYEADDPPTGADVIRNVRSEDLRYYCFGTWNGDKDKRCFLDGRLPQPLTYPIEGQGKKDRFYFRVREYSAARPAATSDLKEIVEALNQPRVVASRLLGAAVGFDREKEGGRNAG